MIQKKRGNELQIGDKVVTHRGEKVTIKRISKGMISGMLLIDWRVDWTHVWPDDLIEIVS